MPAPTPRTTEALVKGIISTDDAVSLIPFIQAGNMLTTRLCTHTDDPYTDGYEGSEMEIIERWLAAHFYTIYDNQLTAARAGSAAVEFMHKVDYDLRNSMYGQQAMVLDTKGGLAAWNNTAKEIRKVKVRLDYLGSDCRYLYPCVN